MVQSLAWKLLHALSTAKKKKKKKRNRETYLSTWFGQQVVVSSPCNHCHVCSQRLCEGRASLLLSNHRSLGLFLKMQGFYPAALCTQGWGREEGLPQRYPHLLVPASMALEERLSPLNTTFDKWGERTITSRKLIKLPGKYECK